MTTSKKQPGIGAFILSFAACGLLGWAGSASASTGPAHPVPYHVTVQVGQDGAVYHTTCRKLYHQAPVYIFSSCRPVRRYPAGQAIRCLSPTEAPNPCHARHPHGWVPPVFRRPVG